MASIAIPEVILYKALNAVFTALRNDYNNKVDKEKTVLHYIFGKDENGNILKFNTFVWFDQSVEVLIGRDTKLRMVEWYLGYNMKRLNVPTIHIMLPSESPINSGIGSNEGYIEAEIDTHTKVVRPVYTQDSQVTFNLLITSDNYNEVLIIYNFLKSIFLSIKTHLELSNLQNVTFSGSDMNFNEDLMPANIFHRNFNVSFSYDFSSIDLFDNLFGDKFKDEGKIE